MKNKQLSYDVVKHDNGGWAVKTKIGGKWYTAVETYCIPGKSNSQEIAELMAALLNQQERIKNSPRQHTFDFYGWCVKCEHSKDYCELQPTCKPKPK